ncbi:MAG: hypothetical protein V3U54_13280 [Thermodesulfobacteriota bacterium]
MKTRYAVQLIDPNQLGSSLISMETLEKALEFVKGLERENKNKEYIIQIVISHREK